jgi:hypothetical protein
MSDAPDVQPLPHHLKAAEYHERAANHHRDAVAHSASGELQAAAYDGEMARAAELFAAQFGKAATEQDRVEHERVEQGPIAASHTVAASVTPSTARADAEAVARQENEGGPAVAQGTSGERLILLPSDPQAGQLPSRRRRVR